MRMLLFTILFAGLGFSLVYSPVYAAIVPCDGPDCQSCHFIQLGDNIIRFVVEMMVYVCTFTIIYAGFKMVMGRGDPHAISAGREMVANTVIGFAILLSAWLMVDTAMKLLLNDQVKVGPWNQIACVGQPTGTAQNGGTPAPSPSSGSVTQYSCAGANASSCVPVSSTNIPSCVGGSGTRIVNPDYAKVLESAAGGWCATSVGIESGHANACHTTYANCIDAKCASGGAKKDCTAVEAASVQNTFKSKGLWPVYELPGGTSQATLDAFRAQGVCAYIESAATGPHFSVYVSRESGAGQFNKANCN